MASSEDLRVCLARLRGEVPATAPGEQCVTSLDRCVAALNGVLDVVDQVERAAQTAPEHLSSALAALQPDEVRRAIAGAILDSSGRRER